MVYEHRREVGDKRARLLMVGVVDVGVDGELTKHNLKLKMEEKKVCTSTAGGG